MSPGTRRYTKWTGATLQEELLTISAVATTLGNYSPFLKPTVCLGVTSAMVYTYGCGDGRIEPTRYALNGRVLGDSCRQCRGCRTPPAAG